MHKTIIIIIIIRWPIIGLNNNKSTQRHTSHTRANED